MTEAGMRLSAAIVAVQLLGLLEACDAGKIGSSRDSRPAVDDTPAARAASSAPRPTEVALRAYVDSLVRGQPSFDQMNPDVANAMRGQPQLAENVARLGAPRSVDYQGIDPTNGSDRYKVSAEFGVSEWKVRLGPDGKIDLLAIHVGGNLPENEGQVPLQVADLAFRPVVEGPTFAEGQGPVVFIDEAHDNFHTASGRYQPFATLLRRDGYVVSASTVAFDKVSLSEARVLVIANATGSRNRPPFNAPIEPAFSDVEVKAVRERVDRGGALLLIVDHFPWPDAARRLADAFGIHFDSGTASVPEQPGPLVFRRSDHSLADHPIVRGRTAGEQVDSVATFTGAAFKVDAGEPLLAFVDPQAFAVTPRVFGQPSNDDPRTAINGWQQGATLRVGKGRVAVFGEAAMFTAQLAGGARVPMGMNHPLAKKNAQFALNVMHWLCGMLDEPEPPAPDRP
jgi:hypothetical protein